MKKLLTIALLIFSVAAGAQQFGNEWIDYNKTYYKFKIAANGLYRIPSAALAAVNLGGVDASHFQLWHNGEEIPVYTSVASGALGSGGYIEFWGQKNDGKADNILYRMPDQQLSDAKSLFTDSAAYFLTVNPAGGNRRLINTPNTLPVGATPEPYFMYRADTGFSEQIHLGKAEGSGLGTLYVASIEEGEGWTSADINEGQSKTFQQHLYAYTGAGAPAVTIQMNVVGANIATKKAQLTVNGTLVFDQSLFNFGYSKLSKTLPAGILSGGAEAFSVTDVATVPSRIRLASLAVTYARKFDFGGAANFAFSLPARGSGYYLEISNFSFSGGAPVLYDRANGRRYTVDDSNPTLLKVFLPATTQAQELVLVSRAPANMRQVPALEPRTFVNYNAAQNQGDYLMITNRALLSGSNGSQPVNDYRSYRASAAGGGYNAKIYLVDQLADQFAYGIDYHPSLVRNFLRFARTRFSSQPRQVFLIGKGVSYVSSRLYPSYELAPQLAQLNLVPTFGYPSSDVLLAAEGSSSQPLTPIGRLSVVNGNEVAVYLEKVKQYEQQLATTSPGISESAWKKTAIHIVGANDQATQDLLEGDLRQHQKIIEGGFSGAVVETFVKNSSNVLQQQVSERLASHINSGANLLTYFGHSSATSLGFNMEDPGNYSNAGKYPLFNMMGCNVGDIFGYTPSRLSDIETVSEKYVLAKDRGCIGMMAGTSVGYISTLDVYNTQLYSILSGRDYGKTIGELMTNTIAEVYKRPEGESALLQRAQCEEYTLNGDPAIRLYQPDKPDYAIEDASVSIAPNFISVAETNFAVKVNINNLGKAVNEKVVVELKRTFPDQSVKVFRKDTLDPVRYLDSLNYSLPIDPVKDKGQNRITITIDPENTIEELNEGNNSTVKDVFIFEDEIRPVYPYTYAIVNQPNVTLAASTANPLATTRTYLMEMDTTALFSSPFKIARTQVSSGGVVEFTPGASLKNNTVYFWRVASKPDNGEQPHWNTASFIYIQGDQVGFNQSHVHQLLDNTFDRMSIDSATRKTNFREVKHELVIKAAVFPTAGATASDNAVTVDGRDYIRSVCGVSGIIFNVFEPNSMTPWVNAEAGQPGRFGSDPVCGDNRKWNFQYNILDANKRKSAAQFLDSIPDGYVVVFRNISGDDSSSNTYADTWKNDAAAFGEGNTIYHKLKAQGFATIDSFYRPRAFIFTYKKNDPSFTPATTFSEGISDKIEQKVNPYGPDSLGYMTSPVFGPAKAWKKLQWNGNELESGSDIPAITLTGVSENGSETPLQNLDLAKQEVDLSSINAVQFPYLKLSLENKDAVSYTPYQFRYWRLFYTPGPEGAIAPNLYLSVKDTIDAGEPLNVGVVFKNVSAFNFDSIKVKLSIRNQNNAETLVAVPDQKALVAGDTIKLTVPVNLKQLPGKNTLFVEFNPVGAQPEQYHFNNFLYKEFLVRGDTTSPYMDVTFDGIHILNRDIVSAKPDILVKLTDDAKWLLLDNPDLIRVQLINKNRNITYNYKVGTDTLKFTPPSNGDENAATMNFRPHMEDGDYELLVSAKDQSGNEAGQVQYRVGFQVINKPMISNMLNYPNPFTTATAFVFTLTGSEVPQNLRIQILTITGKIVREITSQELGPLRIGRNITEYRWDGTDQYGQKLANGVYLYRVITNLHGKSLDKYRAKDDNTDKYFNKGYGKMYLMR
ncbi:C25 family cysteine peptidase [Niabella aurantiaca]|uniref:putative type IX secretion system sortase PorU2 n=1 Tax=Niabella aurantiaca TaxID=379900 RepID=UPI00035FF101|nr:C25 family cysteine peptidase [Niabella aurantiaca]